MILYGYITLRYTNMRVYSNFPKYENRNEKLVNVTNEMIKKAVSQMASELDKYILDSMYKYKGKK